MESNAMDEELPHGEKNGNKYIDCVARMLISLILFSCSLSASHLVFDLLPTRALEKIFDYSNVSTQKTLAEISPGMNMIHNAKVLDDQMGNMSLNQNRAENKDRW
jgi:hypothetical protein